jgi:hypothetical protein
MASDWPQTSSRDPIGPSISADDVRHQLEKLLRSEAFRNAHHLQRFLEYVASKTIDGLSDEIKEYSIGREVFDRPESYDPRVDTVVRVQAHRLREKLDEYYSCEGASDEILLEVPKGHYVPRFSRRVAILTKPENGNPAAASTGSPAASVDYFADPHASEAHPSGAKASRSSRWWREGLLAVLCLLIGLALSPLLRRISQPVRRALQTQAGEAAPANTQTALKGLWAGFFNPGSSVIVAYSDAVFLSTKGSDLLRIRTSNFGELGTPVSPDAVRRLIANPRLLLSAGPLFVQDVYTGTGEVMAVFYLTRMFDQFHISMKAERSRLVTADDLRSHNIIFLGSTMEDPLLAKLPLDQHFGFDFPRGPKSLWRGRLLNLDPQPGANASYGIERDPRSGVVRTDYALLSVLPSITADRKIVVLGGLTTLGTEAAARFATSPVLANELARELGTGSGFSRTIPPFLQAVLKVEIVRGDILSVEYVTGCVIHENEARRGLK